MQYLIDTLRLKNKKIPPGLFYDDSIKKMELSNAVIRYKIVGNGDKTIIFIPDAPNTIEHYENLCDQLKDKFKVIVFELPGFGFSGLKTSDFKFSIEESTKMCIEFLEKLGFKKYILSFPCVTGYIALNIAEKRTDLVEGLVLVQTPSFEEEINWYKVVDNKKLFGKPVLGQLFNLFMKKKVAKMWYKAALPKDKYDENYYVLTEKGFDKGSEFCLASAFQGIFLNPKSKKVYTIPDSIHVLSIWGNADRSHKKTNKKSLSNYMKEPGYIFMENAGHFPELEYPVEFSNAIINKFNFKTTTVVNGMLTVD